MPLFTDYASSNEYKSFVHVDTADTADDAQIAVALTAASRAIDKFCNRQFGQITVAAARFFTWDKYYMEGREALPIFDLYTTTDLAVVADLDDDGTYETTLTNGTDFDLYPWDADDDSRPWTHMVMRDTSAYNLPSTARGVRITARWGWTAVPSSVKQACLLQADVLMKRRQAGLVGDYTSSSKYLDRDVQMVLGPFKRYWGAV